MEALARQILLSPAAACVVAAGAIAALLALDRVPRWSTTVVRVLEAAFAAVACLEGLGLVLLCAARLGRLAEWDFPHFYVVARTARNGGAFYAPQALAKTFAAVLRETDVPRAWLSEIGYWYPPPSALAILPLGAFGYRTALALHYAVQAAFLAGAVLLLAKAAPLARGRLGVAAACALVLGFAPVASAFSVAQITPAALFFAAAALALVERRPALAGASLAAGSLFKPLLLIPAVLAPALGRPRILLGCALATGLFSLAATATFGASVWRDFLQFGPNTRPPGLATDPVVHSLLAVLLRASGGSAPRGLFATLAYPPYLAAASVMALTTVLVCRKSPKQQGLDRLQFASLLTLALAVYPNTLYNTLPLVLPALLVLVAAREHIGFSSRFVCVAAGSCWGLLLIRKLAFLVVLIAWGLAVAAVAKARPCPKQTPLLEPVR